jgi:hypothetical protein
MVEYIRQAFARSPKKSIRKASREMQIPCSTEHKVVHKTIHLYAYKVETVQALKSTDYDSHSDFTIKMLDRTDHDNRYLDSMTFLMNQPSICRVMSKSKIRGYGGLKNHML